MIFERRFIKLTILWQFALFLSLTFALDIPGALISFAGDGKAGNLWRLILGYTDGWGTGIALALVLLPLIIAFILSKCHTRRIQALINCAESLGRGNLSARYVANSKL